MNKINKKELNILIAGDRLHMFLKTFLILFFLILETTVHVILVLIFYIQYHHSPPGSSLFIIHMISFDLWPHY